MTTDEAIKFLQTQTPLPADEDLSDQLIEQYDQVRKHLLAHPDPRSIGLLLNSFGQGSGFGVYQLVEDVIKQFSPKEVVPLLREALTSPRASVRYWANQIASNFVDPALVKPLADNLVHPSAEVRSSAADALASIGDRSVLPVLERARKNEADADVRKAMDAAVRELTNTR